MPQKERLENRLEKILFLLKKRSRMETKDLSKIFRVSEVTIRNDLNELSKQGLVIRSYGGATIANYPADYSSSAATVRYTEGDEDNIGKIASEMVKDGDVLFIDSSRAAVSLTKHIMDRQHLTVFTDSVEIAYKLTDSRGCSVYITGGRIDNETKAVNNSDLSRLLGDNNIAKAFLGTWGMTPEQGMTDPRPDEEKISGKSFQKREK